ncbi:DUF2232 domain-containing protein [Oceanibaculum pacificum]|uniref:DUF2232 domain-containing protein n=1 Tax=Oceanibaculum pacificum TaxID=580166 RepID=A0A154WEL6_9PROT|nr:DUF2232 domain-containing protein [Oceanibaculum pacificum]KZD11952.1 hypothetical protein AUP43_05605 [Oceanibaculum pacificum]
MARYWGFAGSAGLASAALYLSVILGSPGAFLLAYLAPLPLFLAGLGLGLSGVAVAGIVGSLIVFLAGGSFVAGGLYFAIEALPIVILVQRALLSRQGEAGPGHAGTLEWYPPGLLVTWLVGMAALLVTVAWLALSGSEGGLAGTVERFLSAGLSAMLETGDAGADMAQRQQTIGTIAALFPGVAAASWIVMLAINGALAQGLLSRFDRNIRPSPRMAETFLPGWMLPALLAAALVGLAMPGGFGYIGRNLMVVLAVAYLFAGLGVIHAFVARMKARQVMMVGIYVTMVLFGWPVILAVVLGVVDQMFGLRRRFAGPAQGEE